MGRQMLINFKTHIFLYACIFLELYICCCGRTLYNKLFHSPKRQFVLSFSSLRSFFPFYTRCFHVVQGDTFINCFEQLLCLYHGYFITVEWRCCCCCFPFFPTGKSQETIIQCHQREQRNSKIVMAKWMWFSIITKTANKRTMTQSRWGIVDPIRAVCNFQRCWKPFVFSCLCFCLKMRFWYAFFGFFSLHDLTFILFYQLKVVSQPK